jgi:hypothetical protein
MQTSTKISFRIEKRSLWRPAQPGAKAEIPEVQALLRRRASEADRAALRVAFDVCGMDLKVPTLFCSRHGEVQRSVELLDQLAKGETLSPMGFALSVHNAAAALFSISQANTCPMSALAAGRDSLPQGMLEAAGMLEAGSPQVLLIAYDGALPEPYQRFKDEDDPPYGLGLLLSRSQGEPFSLELGAGSAPASGTPHALQLAAFLDGQAGELQVPSARAAP